jgi:hypothetical protein
VLQKHASLRGTLCPPGQSKKAIGPESPIGPCIATPGVDNRPACCFRKRWRRHKQRNGTTGKNNRISVSHAETKQNPLPGEDHSQSKRLRSNGWAECRDKKGPASSRGGKICLDIPFNRTYRLPDLPGGCINSPPRLATARASSARSRVTKVRRQMRRGFCKEN